MTESKTTSKKDDNFMPNGKFAPGNNANPTGKGGFQERPEDISRTGRPKNEQRFGYWLQFFKNLTNKEFQDYIQERNKDEMYVAELMAYERIMKARKEFKEYQDLADRTEGKPKQAVDLTTQGEKLGSSVTEVAKVLREIYADDETIPKKDKSD